MKLFDIEVSVRLKGKKPEKLHKLHNINLGVVEDVIAETLSDYPDAVRVMFDLFIRGDK